MDLNKYYGQLVGATITDFKFKKSEYYNPFPVYTLEQADQKVDLVLSQDEEGNGGGFAFIENSKVVNSAKNMKDFEDSLFTLEGQYYHLFLKTDTADDIAGLLEAKAHEIRCICEMEGMKT
jgi:hypothetical protein